MRTLSIIIILCLAMTGFAQEPVKKSENNSIYRSLLGSQGKTDTPPQTTTKPATVTNLKPLVAWNAIVEMDNKIYPSYVWAIRTFDYLDDLGYNPYYHGDSEGQVGITFQNYTNKASNVKLVIEAPEIMRTSEHTCFIAQNEKVVEIFPEIDYKMDVLNRNYQPRPVLVKFTLYVDGKHKYTKTQNVVLESIYECPYAFYHRSGTWLDQNFMFAAYVNENHPKINDEILPSVTSSGIVNKITGYLDYGYKGDAASADVLRQVFGVWNTLRNKNIKYSSITGANTSQQVIDQHVRTINQTLTSSHANCIDGTVLMASILYKMGIDPMIVLVPGHAYLGFYLDPANPKGERTPLFLETTMLGSSVDASKLSDGIIEIGNGILSKDDIILKNYRSSYVAFLGALESATLDYKKNANNFNKGDIQYRIFEVDAYRKAGLLPLNH